MVKAREAKEWAREHVKGLWTSPTIPFTEDFSVDEKGIRHNIERCIAVKAGGIGLGFSEPWVLTIEERKRIIEIAVDAANHRLPLYVHTTDHSVAETVNLTKHAAAVGADAVMIWPPYEWAKDQQTIYDYYAYVAENADIPIFLYNTFHSGNFITPETTARLAKIPNVCALKDAINDVGNTLRCLELCGKEIVVSQPSEAHQLTMVLHFGQQVMLGTTSVFLWQSADSQPIYDYWHLAQKGDGAAASRLYYQLQPLRDVWGDIYRVLRNKNTALHPLAHIKCWMDLIGMAGGPVRPPMHQLTDEEKAKLRSRIEATGWLSVLYPQRSAA